MSAVQATDEPVWTESLDTRLAQPAADGDPDHIGHGYRYSELREIALMAARAWRYPRVASYDDRREWAFDGIVDLVLTSVAFPTVAELVRAGNDAIRHQVYAVSQMNGRPDRRSDGQPQRSFVIFWHTPHLEVPVDGIIDKIAVHEIMPELTGIEQAAIRALAFNDFNPRRAAQWLGVNYSTYLNRITRARRRFAEHWYYPDTPAGYWRVSNAVTDTDERRQTRRRTMLMSLCKRNHGWDCGCGYADRLEGDA